MTRGDVYSVLYIHAFLAGALEDSRVAACQDGSRRALRPRAPVRCTPLRPFGARKGHGPDGRHFKACGYAVGHMLVQHVRR